MKGEINMYCNTCGLLVNEGSFCTKCGAKATYEINVTKESHNELSSEPKKFTFIRRKSIGRGELSRIISEVTITDSILTIKQQKIISYFFKQKPIESIHNVMDIASIKIVRTFDKSDTFFSIIFAILGFFNPLFFILTIIFFWVGMGKNIQITKSNGATISIPGENSKSCSELSESLMEINRGITFQQKN